jgi:hypothetical protein
LGRVGKWGLVGLGSAESVKSNAADNQPLPTHTAPPLTPPYHPPNHPPVHVERALQLLRQRAHLCPLPQQLPPQRCHLALEHLGVGGAGAQRVELAAEVSEADLEDADFGDPLFVGGCGG